MLWTCAKRFARLRVSPVSDQHEPNTTMNGNKFADKVQSATLEDAIKWEATEEKTMFCVEFLEAASVNQIDSFWQEELEDKFESLLAAR